MRGSILVRRVLVVFLLCGSCLRGAALPSFRRGAPAQPEEGIATPLHGGRDSHTNNAARRPPEEKGSSVLARALTLIFRLRSGPVHPSPPTIPDECVALLRAAGESEKGLPTDVREALLSRRAGADALAGFLRLRRAGLLTRGVAALHPMLRDRCAADPHDAFAPALLAEVAIGCASKLAAQVGPAQFKNNYFAEMCSGSEDGSYLRLIDFHITQLSARE